MKTLKLFEAPQRSAKIKIQLLNLTFFFFNTTFRNARDVKGEANIWHLPISEYHFNHLNIFWNKNK